MLAQTTRLMSTAALLATLAGTAHAQSLNIEIFSTAGSPSTPSNNYGAATGQTGVWNSIRAGSVNAPNNFTALSLAGALTGVSIALGSNNGGGSGSFGSGDYANLMADYANGFGDQGQINMTFSGLTPAFYRAWVYCALPASQASYVDSFGFTVFHPMSLSATVNNVVADLGNAAGPSTSNVFTINRTHDILNFRVTAANQAVTLSVRSDPNYFASLAAMNGVQLVQYTSPRLYVDLAATGTGTGQSWTNAITSLTTALDVARGSGGFITEIWVANGVYKPTTTTSRSVNFNIPSGVKIYGGFSGNEVNLNQRDPQVNLTFLSGDIGTPRVSTDNSYNVVVMSNCNSTTLLDGFRIISGNANGSGTQGAGGGIRMIDSSARIRNCAFTDHSGNDGAAVKVTGTSSPIFTNCEFYRNVGNSGGGGIDYDGPIGFTSFTLRVSGCKFGGNSNNNGGAGILVVGTSSISNSIFSGNQSILSGGGFRSENTSLVNGTSTNISNCTFFGNTSTNAGAGIGGDGKTTIGIYNSIIWGNQSILGSGTADGYDSDNAAVFDFDRTIIQGAILLPGSTNYFFDPLFVDANGPDNIVGTFDDNLQLQMNSPAINAGRPNYIPADYGDADEDGNTVEPLPLDLAGKARVLPNGSGVVQVDIGAYETVVFPACAIDFNADGFLNQEDLSGYLTAFLSDPNPAAGPSGTSISPCPGEPIPYAAVGYAADYTRDCVVNQEDLSGFITEYFSEAENPTGCTPG